MSNTKEIAAAEIEQQNNCNIVIVAADLAEDHLSARIFQAAGDLFYQEHLFDRHTIMHNTPLPWQSGVNMQPDVPYLASCSGLPSIF